MSTYSGFLPHAQVNPSGYSGGGRGLSPLAAVAPPNAQLPVTQQEVVNATDRTVAPAPATKEVTTPASFLHPSRYGVGGTERAIGVLGHRL